jgi:cellulose synthase/poly-beta-1,6-N-acetylglucosamine synthase-like glycosyltransferase
LEVSVIIPAYNAAATIGACLESVLAQRTVDEFEVLVIDDGSTDSTAQIAGRYPCVRVLRQENAGASAARNLGAWEARGWILCFIDADCEATPGWLDTLAGAIRAGADGAKGTLLSSQPEIVARFTQIEYEDRYDRMRDRPRINFIDMGSAAYRRDIMLGVGEGGFDTRYPGASVEDQEFSFRLVKKGCDLRFAGDAAVYHRHPTTVRAYARRKFNIARWKVLVHVRHPERVISDSHTPPGLKAQLLLLGAIALSLAAAPFKPGALRLCALLMAAFQASALPFIVKAARKDPQVAALSPLILPARAACLGSGLLYGMVALILQLTLKREPHASRRKAVVHAPRVR